MEPNISQKEKIKTYKIYIRWWKSRCMGHRVLEIWEKKSFYLIRGDQEIPLIKQLSRNLKEKMESVVKISRGKCPREKAHQVQRP